MSDLRTNYRPKKIITQQQLIHFLQIKKLINDETKSTESDELYHNCVMHVVSQMFGGSWKQLIEFIALNCRFEDKKLKIIHNIISTQKRNISKNYTRKTSSTSFCSSSSTSSINSLPSVCLDHIAQYLKKQDVSKLKSTSRQFGIISIQHMSKLPISVLPVKNTLYHQQFDVYSLHIQKHKGSSTTRYLMNALFDKIYEDWSEQYKISRNNQLIFKQIENDHFSLVNKSVFKYNSINDSNLDEHNFLLHDAKQLMIINQDEIRKYNHNTDSDVSMINYRYKLKRIHYFDVIEQKLYQAGYVFCSIDLPIPQFISYITMQSMYTIYICIYIHIYIHIRI